MSEELTHTISRLINIASQLPPGQPKVVNLSMPIGSGKTTAILNLLKEDDILIVSGVNHYREIVKLNMIKNHRQVSVPHVDAPYREKNIIGITSVLERVTVLSATLKKDTHEVKVDWGRDYSDYKNRFETTKPYVELNCLGNLPREAIMGGRWNPRVIFVDEPNSILQGKNFQLLVDALRGLIRGNYETIIVGVGT